MLPVFKSGYDGIQQVGPRFLVGDFAVVLGVQYEVIWVPSAMTIKGGLTLSEAKDLVQFLGGTERGQLVAYNEIARRTNLFGGRSKVEWREDIPSVLVESFKRHKKGSETPYREQSVSEVEYEVEVFGSAGRDVATLQDEHTAMAMALGYEAKMQSGKPNYGAFVRITRIDPPASRTVIWWAMWDQDGWRTVHKDPSLPFDPDALDVKG